MALTKAEVAEHLFEKVGLSKRDAKDMVEIFFEDIPILARKVVTFRPGQKLKSRVEDGNSDN
jgi:integration host factor subunit alpha